MNTLFGGSMEFHLFERTKDSITVCIANADTTLMTPVLNKLSDDPNVSVVRFVDKHPELEDPILMVSVNKGTPEEAIKRAVHKISEYYSKVNIVK